MSNSNPLCLQQGTIINKGYRLAGWIYIYATSHGLEGGEGGGPVCPHRQRRGKAYGSTLAKQISP